MPKIGIAEVAALAGVSPATASRAMRPNFPGVAAATRAAVQAAAQKLDYVPSPSAVSLSTGRTGAVGVLAPWLSRWFFAAVIEGVQQALHELGYDLLLYPAGSGSVPGAGVLDVRDLYKRVDGVIALSVPVGIDSLKDLRIPAVTVGGYYPDMGAVLIDDVKAGRTATNHLIALGHRVICFIGEEPNPIFGFTAAEDRLEGYRQALEAAGISYDPLLVEFSGFSTNGGHAGIHRVWARAQAGDIPRPTAVVAVSDEPAIGVLHAAHQQGLRIPSDLSVMGMDNHQMSYLFDLTTIAQPVRLLGSRAVRLLLDQIRNPTRPLNRVVLEAEMVCRGTTGPV